LKTFLDDIIFKLNEEYTDIADVVIVLPSKRASLFFKEALIRTGLRSSWLPKILTLNELVDSLFKGQIDNSITLLSELYSIARKMNLKEAESFEAFYRWGDVLLHDFSTIESYAVNGSDLYRNLREIEKIERWSFSEDKLSKNQIAFNDFWMKQGDLYAEFTAKLKSENRSSSAMALRFVAENAEELLAPYADKHFMIAGFNALSLSEQKLISNLLKIGKSFFIADTDAFFIKGNREAGYFYRQIQKKYSWEGLKEIPDQFAASAKDIEMISVTQRSAIALVCSQLLKKKGDLSNTALVLGDESLLESVITSLPDNVGTVNITMGFKLRNTPVYDLFLAFYAMQLRIKKKDSEIYYKDLLRFLNHPYIAKLFGAPFISEVKRFIVSQNLIFVGEKHIKDLSIENNHKELFQQFLFQPWNDFPQDPSRQIIAFVEAIQKLFDPDKKALDLEYLFHFKKVIQQLELHIIKYRIKLGLNGYKVLFAELLKTSSISFQGEPLAGLQIMGLLETRALDFEDVIVLGLNEGNIPKTSTPQSFIPWDLKNYFGLPGRKEQDALYAYYFYRLIQRASKLSFVYASQSGKDLKSAEASRYLKQLAYYNANGETKFSIHEYQTKLDHLPKANKDIKIKRNDFYRQKLQEKFEKGLSPTALSTYLNCPLDFYFKYILGLQESDEVDEEMGADVVGNIIHKVLEDLYKPYVGGRPDFKIIRQDLDAVSKKVIQEQMKNRWIKTGINKMNIEIIETLLNKFISIDEAYVAEQLAKGKNFEIVEVEKVLSRVFDFEIEGAKLSVKLRGFADRIEKLDNTLRIIDYKTGKVDKLSRVEITKVFSDAAWSKALQLLMYQAMYDDFKDPSLEVGIVGFRDLAKYVQSIQLKKEDQEDVANLFYDGLKELLSKMLYDEDEIVHNPKSKWCKFCELH
jgi:CRISPR/Cas system-associated exonuclease Cas4 (RecB family)